jgi:signal transduction histidine kinase
MTGLLLATLAATRRRVRAAATAAHIAEAESAAVWNERTRIARELHDTLAQDFASLALQLELLRNHVPSGGKPGEHLAQAGNIVRQSLSETRDAIWMLRGDALRQSGLPAALEALLQRLVSRSSVSFEFTLEGRPVQLPHLTEHHLLRITKECVQNALRHASAHQILVRLLYASHSVGLQIEDDGRGFDSSGAASNGNAAGFGLRGLRERVDEIQGSLQIQSGQAHGTRIQIDFPMP